ncbi:MAG: penicillin-binding protein, partial [Candidatus Colwellbacteria bacterium]|nr:penicillin-binding protein [Candidatus Colwellbacteria bacterium]
MRTRMKKLRLLIAAIALGVFVATAAGASYVFSIVQTLPAHTLIENRQVAESTKIYDRTGEVLLYEIHGEEKRTIVPFDEIPDVVKEATIAVEDSGFYSHSAVDWTSVVRALIANVTHGGIVQGGSTITQQLAKKAFLSDERTFTRKVKELALAVKLEQTLTKDEILNLYLNQIPYCSNAYGIEAASQVFFEKSAADLTLNQAALLASLPKAPSYYSPWGEHRSELLARKDTALDRMVSVGFISAGEAEAAKATDLVFSGTPLSNIRAPHFVSAVQAYLTEQYGDDLVTTGGLTVTTTLDWDLQQLAEEVVREGAARNEGLYQGTNAALVAQDPATGQILAMVGSRDYFDAELDGNFNVVTQGLRQPGSAIKPLVYAAAFSEGYTPDTVVFETGYAAAAR